MAEKQFRDQMIDLLSSHKEDLARKKSQRARLITIASEIGEDMSSLSTRIIELENLLKQDDQRKTEVDEFKAHKSQVEGEMMQGATA